MRRALLLALLSGALATPAAASSVTYFYGDDGAAVKQLCLDAMTPEGADEKVSKEIDGLCECELGAIIALNEKAPNQRFFQLWAKLAGMREAMQDMKDDEREEAADAILSEVYAADPELAKTEPKAYAKQAMALTEICVSGFTASGKAAPPFEPLHFLKAFDKPD